MLEILILSASLILLGLLLLLSLALSVVGLIRKQKSLRTIGLIAFLCFACLFVSGSVYTGEMAVGKVYATARTFRHKAVGKAHAAARTLADKAWTITAKIIGEVLIIAWNDDRTFLIQDHNPQILLLKSYVPDATLSTINPQYYTYFGFRDWWRFPLVYPYSIHTIDTVDLGWLYDESKVTDFVDGIDASKNMGIRGITHLALDKDYLLLRVQDSEYMENGPIRFIIFNFNTGEKRVFDSESEMFERAKELNFKSKLELVTLREYNALFSKNK